MSSLASLARSYAVAQRRSQRIQKAGTREALREYKAQEKANVIQTNMDIVKNYDELVDSFTNMHREIIQPINWFEVLEEPEPVLPQPGNIAEQVAQDALHLYTPSFFDRLFAQQKKKIKKLTAKLEIAKMNDDRSYQAALEAHTAEKTEWTTMQTLAKGILQRDTAIYKQAVEKLIPFGSLPIGKNLNIVFDPLHITVDLLLNLDEIIPQAAYSLTSTGKLSEKKIPVSRRNDLYQDHVCSSMLRTAIEIITVLPVEFVVVNGLLDMLNPANGKLQEQPAASIAFVPETLLKLNLTTTDPTDAFKNFIHNMRFSKTNGFQPVDRIDAKTLVIATS